MVRQPVVTYNPVTDTTMTVWRDARGTVTPTLRLQRTLGDGTALGTNLTLTHPLTETPVGFASAFNGTTQETMVVWERKDTSTSATIMATRVDATGQVIAKTALTTTSEDRRSVQVVSNPDANEYLVVWVATPNPPTTAYRLVAQRVAANGTPIGSPITVVTQSGNTAAVVYHPRNHEYLVVWKTPTIKGQRLAADGSLLGSAQTLTGPQATACCEALSVAALPSTDTYLLTWVDLNRNGSGQYGTYVQRLSAQATPVGAEVVVSPPVSGQWQRNQTIVANAELNEYLVLWNQQDAIYGHVIEANGQPRGSRILLAAAGSYVKEFPYGVARTDTSQYRVGWVTHFLEQDFATLARQAPTHFPRFQDTAPNLAATIRDFETMDDSDQHIMQASHQEAFCQAAVLEPYGVAATALMLPQWEWFTRDEIPLLKQAYDAIKDNPQWVDGIPFLKDPDAFADLFAYDEPYDLIGSAW